MRNFFVVTLFALLLCGCGAKDNELSYEGAPTVWSATTFSFSGPELSETRETFLDYSLDVVFTHEDGHGISGLGYFAASGVAEDDGAVAGQVWETKFVPDAAGKWSYTYMFRNAPGIALNTHAFDPARDQALAGSGDFVVRPAGLNTKATDFSKKGMLQDVKQRYLQFSGTKDFFLKTGAGSPENILAYSDFDGTYDVGGTNFPALGKNQLHEFEPHLRDARAGDPTWGDGKGVALLGIANYYEEVGVNAQYLVTMNVEGDGQDVFPWPTHDDPYVFDVSKLAQWQQALEHFNARGVLIDMLLTETENESWFEAFDNVEVGKDFADSRKLYYREMVARFGHLNGLVLNLGEENGVVGNSGQDPFRQPTSVEQRRQFAKYIQELNAYDHAVVSHNWPDSEEATYGALLGDEDFSGISLQAHDKYFEKIVTWTNKSKAAGRPWMITVDEPLGWEFGARPDSEDPTHQREIEGVLWPTLMAGGAGVDWYFGWQNNAPTSDLSNEDQRSRDQLWLVSKRVTNFMQDTVDLPTLSARTVDNGTIIATAKDHQGRDVKLTLERKKPAPVEGDGHQPSEYIVDGLVFEHEGTLTRLDPLNPKL